MCHLVNISVFQKYHSGEEGALIPFVYIQIRYPSHSSPYSSFPNTFEGQGYCGLGMNRTGQRLRMTPARFFLRCGLSFSFLRGAGLVGSVL